MIGQIALNSLALGSIYALTALGFVIIFRASDVVNFAQGEMMMLGAMVGLLLYRDVHLSYSIAFVISIVICMFGGAVVERPHLRHAHSPQHQAGGMPQFWPIDFRLRPFLPRRGRLCRSGSRNYG